MYSLLENVFLSKELYQELLSPICEKYDLSNAELVTLLYLGSDLPGDTATDIVRSLRMAKSAVSKAVRNLQERGYISGEHIDGNHRTVHLSVCDSAKEIVECGLTAQRSFFEIVTEGFAEAEIEQLKVCFERMRNNITLYQKSMTKKG